MKTIDALAEGRVGIQIELSNHELIVIKMQLDKIEGFKKENKSGDMNDFDLKQNLSNSCMQLHTLLTKMVSKNAPDLKQTFEDLFTTKTLEPLKDDKSDHRRFKDDSSKPCA